MQQLNKKQASVIVSTLESTLFTIKTNCSVIDQSESSFTEDGAYTDDAFNNLQASNRAIEALQTAIENLKDIR